MIKRKGTLTDVCEEDLIIYESNIKSFWKGVTEIGDRAFKDCRTVSSIEVPKGVNTIGVYAFANCTTLRNIKVPSTVTSIGEAAFRNCKKLEKIDIPSGVEEIKRRTFSACYSLKSISIPSTVKKIVKLAFRKCRTLHTITLPEGVEEIETDAFRFCRELETVKLPDSIKSVGENTCGCKKLSFQFEDGRRFPSAVFAKYGLDFCRNFDKKEGMANFYKLLKRIQVESMSDPNVAELFKLSMALGLFEEDKTIPSSSGKVAKVSDVAFFTLKKLSENGQLKINTIEENFGQISSEKFDKKLLKLAFEKAKKGPEKQPEKSEKIVKIFQNS